MSLNIAPSHVTLNPCEKQRFTADQPNVTWSLSPNRGSIDQQGEYRAPWMVLLTRDITVTATDAATHQTGSSIATICSTPFWMASIATLWFVLFPALIALLFLVWPGNVAPAPVIVTVEPAAVTLSASHPQQFVASVEGATSQSVVWSASMGTITPTGLYVPPPVEADQSAVISAVSAADRTQSGTALVRVTKDATVILTSPVTSIHSGQHMQFKPLGPANIVWEVFPKHGDELKQDGTYTAPQHLTETERVTVTAFDAANLSHFASATFKLAPSAPARGGATWPPELRIFALVMIMGALGSYLGSSRSFVNYVGNRQFVASWGLFYFVRPSFGIGLALLAYLGYRIGAVPGPANTPPGDPYAIAFLAGMVGLFADMTLEKLKDLMTVIFRTPDDRKDKMAPQTTAPGIDSVTASAATGQLTVQGAKFISGAQVLLNNAALPTTFVNEGKLTAAFPAAQYPAGASVTIVVENPDKQKSAAKPIRVGA
jgi:hypothetical protein